MNEPTERMKLKAAKQAKRAMEVFTIEFIPPSKNDHQREMEAREYYYWEKYCDFIHLLVNERDETNSQYVHLLCLFLLCICITLMVLL